MSQPLRAQFWSQPIFDAKQNQNFPNWLVVFEPLWKIWKSIGMMTFPINGKIKNGNQTTNQEVSEIFSPRISRHWRARRHHHRTSHTVAEEVSAEGAETVVGTSGPPAKDRCWVKVMNQTRWNGFTTTNSRYNHLPNGKPLVNPEKFCRWSQGKEDISQG